MTFLLDGRRVANVRVAAAAAAAAVGGSLALGIIALRETFIFNMEKKIKKEKKLVGFIILTLGRCKRIEMVF